MMFLNHLDARVCHKESLPWWMYLGKFVGDVMSLCWDCIINTFPYVANSKAFELWIFWDSICSVILHVIIVHLCFCGRNFGICKLISPMISCGYSAGIKFSIMSYAFMCSMDFDFDWCYTSFRWNIFEMWWKVETHNILTCGILRQLSVGKTSILVIFGRPHTRRVPKRSPLSMLQVGGLTTDQGVRGTGLTSKFTSRLATLGSFDPPLSPDLWGPR